MQRTISKNREKRKERCHKMERKLAAIVDEIDETTENILSDENSSCEADGVHEISLFGSTDACRDGRVDVKGKIGIVVKRLEIKGF